uniref:Methionyl/Leucyl tRNA synthetase domain-containing protein n=1 Tax=Plectus sambesii TaxID=2011161 RepID=A0A914VLT4_9BILA
LHKNGYTSTSTVDQLHCGKCDRFLADRFVEGTCPFPACQYDDARGDQCDKCGQLVNAVELIKPRCKLCGSTPSIRASEHLFLDLDKLQPQLTEHLEKLWAGEHKWSSNSV